MHGGEGGSGPGRAPDQARRTLSGLLRKGKEALRERDADEAVLTANQVPCLEPAHARHPVPLPAWSCSAPAAASLCARGDLTQPWPAQALDVARELTDKRAERAVLRLLARALRMVCCLIRPRSRLYLTECTSSFFSPAPHLPSSAPSSVSHGLQCGNDVEQGELCCSCTCKETKASVVVMQAGDLHGSLRALQASLELSSRLEEASGDVDVLGAIGDTYADLGNMEKAAEACSPLPCLLALCARASGRLVLCIIAAGRTVACTHSVLAGHLMLCMHAVVDGGLCCCGLQFYDRCIAAIQEDPASTSSTWDC